MSNLTLTQINDVRVLADFIKLFCHAKHDRKVAGEVPIPDVLQRMSHSQDTLCPDCAALLAHGMKKRAACPLDPKPTCRSCRIHCYTAEYRQKIREIMAYSGRRMILRGRLDYLWHYFIKS